MSILRIPQHSFGGGILDARLQVRSDLQKYFVGAADIFNLTVKRQGALEKRQGTALINQLTDSLPDIDFTGARLIPFIYEAANGFTLIFVGSKCIVMDEAGAIKQQIDTPYPTGDVKRIFHCQSGDTVFLAHRNHKPAKLVYDKTADSFTYSELIVLNTEPVPMITSVAKSAGWSTTGGTKSIDYVVTAVRNGRESLPSPNARIAYNVPWPSNGIIDVNISVSTPPPDYHVVYKKQSSFFGRIGTTASKETSIATASAPTFPTWNATYHQFIFTRPASVPRPTETLDRLFSTSNIPNYGFANDRGGYCLKSGTLTLTYPAAAYPTIDKFVIRLGCIDSYYRVISGNTLSYKIFYYAGRCVRLKVVLTMSDNTTQYPANSVNGLLNVVLNNTDEGRTFTIDAYAPGTAISDAVNSIATASDVDVEIYARDYTGTKKTVKSVVITPYSNAAATTVCSGSVTTQPNTDNDGVTTGSPFILYQIKMIQYQGDLYKFTDDYITPDITVSPPKNNELFSGLGNYPGLVSLYQQRLVFASSINEPFKFWMSRVGDLYNFNDSETVTEADSIEAELPITEGPNLNAVVTLKDLHLFAESSEWIIRPITGNALSYKTISTEIQSVYGSTNQIKPLTIGRTILFLEASRKTIRELKQDFSASDGYEANDISVICESVFKDNPIVDWAYQQFPDSIVWIVLEDGTLASLTYMPQHEVIALARHTLDGIQIKAVCANKSVENEASNITLLAKDGDDFLLLKLKTETANGIKFALDLSMTAKPADTPDLANRTVIDSTGAIVEDHATLDADTEYLSGYPFASELLTVRPEAQQQTLQATKKKVTSVDIRMDRTDDGVTIANSSEAEPDQALVDVPFKNGGGPETATVNLQSSYNYDSRIRLRHEGVHPVTLMSLIFNIEQL